MRWLVALSVMLVLSGCTVKNGDPTTSHTAAGSFKAVPTRAANATVNATHVQHAPTANLTAAPVNGTAPLNVTFALTGHDADGDRLNWTLTYGDGNRTAGTTLPANVTHGFHLGGNFTVVLVVTDGHANATASVRVKVVAKAGFPPGMDPACQRPDAVDTMTGYYVDDRGSPAVGFATGGGTWLYKETNGIPGLQLTQTPGTAPAPVGGSGDIDTLAVKNHCTGGDELVF